jgi:hypothetical protein
MMGEAHARIAVTTHGVLQVTRLNQPYTYSDMTGAGPNLVAFPPTG